MTPQWPALLQIAVDLTRSLCAADRYQRLLEAVRSTIPCDATALLALRDDDLVPLAVHGLSPQVLGRSFRVSDHPRLAAIVGSQRPVRFPADSALPDPFDGLVEGAPHALDDAHDCLGCPLIVDGGVVGVLTADALVTGAFDGLDREFLAALGALAGAALKTTRLIETIELLAEKRGLVVEELTRGAGEQDASHMLGVSAAIDRVRREIESVARSDLAVLILGETGVGKELAARAVHAGSRRRGAPLIQVNCAALPESVIESELFGHVRGAFTGASSSRPGKFEIADGGTLLLDEIGELPLSVQPVLLRVLQDGEVQRVGADRPLRVDVRIVAATNRDLEREVAAGRFRADLYHRLHVFPLRVPPLRERREDIPLLIAHFLQKFSKDLAKDVRGVTPEALAILERYHWPGNIRELENVLERAIVLGAGDMLGADSLPESVRRERPTRGPELVDIPEEGLDLEATLDDLERRYLQRALDRTSGVQTKAAELLRMTFRQFRYKLQKHSLAKRGAPGDE